MNKKPLEKHDSLWYWDREQNNISTRNFMKITAFKIPLINRFVTISIYPAKQKMEGIRSTVPLKGHIFMADIDVKRFELLFPKISTFMARFHLPDVHVIQTKNGFHLYSLGIFPTGDFHRLLAFCPFCDRKYRHWTYQKGFAVLRTSGDDIEYLTTIRGSNSSRLQSEPHALFLQDRFGIEFDGPMRNVAKGFKVVPWNYYVPKKEE